MAKLGKSCLTPRETAKAVWIPLTQDPSRPARAWTVEKGGDPRSLPFDSKETDSERSDLSKVAQRGTPTPQAPDSHARQPATSSF